MIERLIDPDGVEVKGFSIVDHSDVDLDYFLRIFVDDFLLDETNKLVAKDLTDFFKNEERHNEFSVLIFDNLFDWVFPVIYVRLVSFVRKFEVYGFGRNCYYMTRMCTSNYTDRYRTRLILRMLCQGILRSGRVEKLLFLFRTTLNSKEEALSTSGFGGLYVDSTVKCHSISDYKEDELKVLRLVDVITIGNSRYGLYALDRFLDDFELSEVGLDATDVNKIRDGVIRDVL